MEMIIKTIIIIIVGVAEGMKVRMSHYENGLAGIAAEYQQFKALLHRNPQLMDTLDVINITNDDVDAAIRREKRSARNESCPIFTNSYLQKAESPRERSLSPWKFVREFDARRTPRYLLKAKCLCDGCINIVTGRETKHLRSVPTHMRITVVKTYKRKLCYETANIAIGCTCVVPSRKPTAGKTAAPKSEKSKKNCYKRPKANLS